MKNNNQNNTPDRGLLTAGILFLFVLLSRLPLQSKILYHWDSVNFALSFTEFNIVKEQPQPPGYILYVAIGRLIDLFFNDPQRTMVIISVVSSVLAVVLLYFLGREMLGERAGIFSALFLAVSPLFWFYGEIALPHTLDTVLVILSVFLLYKVESGQVKFVLPAVVVLASAGGIRQQTLVFLLPLAVYTFRKIGWRRFLIAAVVGAVICLLWFIPLIKNVGGFWDYFKVTGDFGERFQSTTSVFLGAGFWGVKRNLTKLVLYSGFAMGTAIIPIFYLLIRIVKERKNWDYSKLIFLGIWFIPSFMFYTFIHMGQQGLVFFYLPMLFLMAGWGVMQCDNLLNGFWKYLAVLMLLMINAAVYLYMPEYPISGSSQRVLTAETIQNSDQYYLNRIRKIKSDYSPESTVIFAVNWHHVEYYLPEYTTIHFNEGGKWEVNTGELTVDKDMQGKEIYREEQKDGLDSELIHIIIFDPVIESLNLSPSYVEHLNCTDGQMLSVLSLQRNEKIVFTSESKFEVRPK